MKKAVVIFSFTYAVIFFYFIHPFFSGWIEITNPIVHRVLIHAIDWTLFVLLFLFPSWISGTLLFLLFIFYSYSFLIIFKSIIPSIYTKSVALVIFIVPVVMVCSIPAGLTFADRRAIGIQFGGWHRIMMSGGPERVKKEGLKLLNSSGDDVPPRRDWPVSLRILGNSITIDTTNQIILIGTGRSNIFSGNYGYLVSGSDSSNLDTFIIELYELTFYVELSEGVYFYQR